MEKFPRCHCSEDLREPEGSEGHLEGSLKSASSDENPQCFLLLVRSLLRIYFLSGLFLLYFFGVIKMLPNLLSLSLLFL